MVWIVCSILLVGLFFLLARFTTVKEGTAKAVICLGEFSHLLFRWKDHWMDEDGKILKKGEKGEFGSITPGLRILGGLYFYGVWPIYQIHRYLHRWTDIRMGEGGKMEVKFHEEEKFNHVLLKPAVYAIKVFAVETAPPERIPVDVTVLITMRILNPYLFLFVAPPTPVEDVLARISALMREAITVCTLDKLLTLRGDSLWVVKEKAEEKAEAKGKGEKKRAKKPLPLLRGAKLVEETLEKWGMKLADRGVEIREINLPPSYQKAAAARKEEEMKATGRAEEIMGTVISSLARAKGLKEKEVQKEFTENPKSFYQKYQVIINNIMTKLSMEGKSYLRIETLGASGIEEFFLDLIGAWKRIPGGSRGEEPGIGKAPRPKENSKKKVEEWRRKMRGQGESQEEEEESQERGEED